MPSKKMLVPSHSTRLNTVFKRFAARTCGTLMPTKQTGGNVKLYGPILMESLPPGNKGLLSPDAARIWLFWQGLAQSDMLCDFKHKIAVWQGYVLFRSSCWN